MFLGIDWGGTYIKAGVVNASGRLLSRQVFSSQGFTAKENFIAKVCELVEKNKKFSIQAVGIGAPGLVNVKKGFIYYLPNIPGWKNFPIQGALREKVKLPVYVDNDANVFALAESLLGEAKFASRVIFLTLGTGLGGAVVLDGKILEGEVSASELGHFPIALSGRRCGCGGEGCVETFVGIRYLLDRYKQLKPGAGAKEVREIFLAARLKEKAALQVWREFSLALGKFLSGMINVFNPEIIVLGGGVAGALPVFRPMLKNVIKNQAMWPMAGKVKIVRARLANAGLVGAAIMAKQRLAGIKNGC